MKGNITSEMPGSLCVKVHVSPFLQSGVRLELVSAMTSGSQSWPPSMLTEVKLPYADYNKLYSCTKVASYCCILEPST